MEVIAYDLYDVVEMKKAHPCGNKNKKFQIIRMGADIKIKCLACGRVIMLDRESFEKRIKKVIEHKLEAVSVK